MPSPGSQNPPSLDLQVATKLAIKVFGLTVKPGDDIGLRAGNHPCLLVVLHEYNKLLDPWTYNELFKKYDKLETLLSEHLGYAVFFESQNPAVSHLYPVKPVYVLADNAGQPAVESPVLE
jgi:hypothetical protein